MAFRIKARAGAFVVLALSICLPLASRAHASTFEVWHRHWRSGAPGTLDIGLATISFQEKGKRAAHSRTWRYDDIQQLTLSPNSLRILTYEDEKRELGRTIANSSSKSCPKTWPRNYILFSGRRWINVSPRI